jgi:hypothetical protein
VFITPKAWRDRGADARLHLQDGQIGAVASGCFERSYESALCRKLFGDGELRCGVWLIHNEYQQRRWGDEHNEPIGFRRQLARRSKRDFKFHCRQLQWWRL